MVTQLFYCLSHNIRYNLKRYYLHINKNKNKFSDISKICYWSNLTDEEILLYDHFKLNKMNISSFLTRYKVIDTNDIEERAYNMLKEINLESKLYLSQDKVSRSKNIISDKNKIMIINNIIKKENPIR